MEIHQILKRPVFNVLFSILLGIGIVAIMRPICKGIECLTYKSPNIKDWNENTYIIGDECYRFKTSVCPCPGNGDEIEPFNGRRVKF